MNTDLAKAFVLETARPLERAVYRFHFEGGDPADVVRALRAYQNPDGGFGHALEPDNWNPRSNPIAVNDAVMTLHRVGALSDDSPMVRDILRYLRSGDGFDRNARRWRFALDANPDYPHAVWWARKGDGIEGFNPSVSLAAFMVCFGGRDPDCEAILREAADDLAHNPVSLGDTLKCYMLGHALLAEHGMTDIVDLDSLGTLISRRAEEIICKDVSKYGAEYVPLPSDFFAFDHSRFITPGIRRWIGVEKAALARLQRADGGFDISWQWYTPYPEFEQARAWWRARITVDKLMFYLNAG